MISNNLKRARLDRGMSVSELARRSKVSRVTITKIENNESNPSRKTIHSICAALEENPTDIFFGSFVNHE